MRTGTLCFALAEGTRSFRQLLPILETPISAHSVRSAWDVRPGSPQSQQSLVPSPGPKCRIDRIGTHLAGSKPHDAPGLFQHNIPIEGRPHSSTNPDTNNGPNPRTRQRQRISPGFHSFFGFHEQSLLRGSRAAASADKQKRPLRTGLASLVERQFFIRENGFHASPPSRPEMPSRQFLSSPTSTVFLPAQLHFQYLQATMPPKKKASPSKAKGKATSSKAPKKRSPGDDKRIDIARRQVNAWIRADESERDEHTLTWAMFRGVMEVYDRFSALGPGLRANLAQWIQANTKVAKRWQKNMKKVNPDWFSDDQGAYQQLRAMQDLGLAMQDLDSPTGVAHASGNRSRGRGTGAGGGGDDGGDGAEGEDENDGVHDIGYDPVDGEADGAEEELPLGIRIPAVMGEDYNGMAQQEIWYQAIRDAREYVEIIRDWLDDAKDALSKDDPLMDGIRQLSMLLPDLSGCVQVARECCREVREAYPTILSPEVRKGRTRMAQVQLSGGSSQRARGKRPAAESDNDDSESDAVSHVVFHSPALDSETNIALAVQQEPTASKKAKGKGRAQADDDESDDASHPVFHPPALASNTETEIKELQKPVSKKSRGKRPAEPDDERDSDDVSHPVPVFPPLTLVSETDTTPTEQQPPTKRPRKNGTYHPKLAEHSLRKPHTHTNNNPQPRDGRKRPYQRPRPGLSQPLAIPMMGAPVMGAPITGIPILHRALTMLVAAIPMMMHRLTISVLCILAMNRLRLRSRRPPGRPKGKQRQVPNQHDQGNRRCRVGRCQLS